MKIICPFCLRIGIYTKLQVNTDTEVASCPRCRSFTSGLDLDEEIPSIKTSLEGLAEYYCRLLEADKSIEV